MNEAALPPCPPRRSEAQPQQKKSNTDAKLLLGK
jgi:hypothetical protein